jgi:hypothetical protein
MRKSASLWKISVKRMKIRLKSIRRSKVLALDF